MYITFGTLPALYAQMNIYLDKTTSYIWTRSGGEFVNEDYYPENLKYYKKFEGFNDIEFLEKQYKEILNIVNEIKEKKPNVKFNVFCDDSRIQFILKIFTFKGLQSIINKLTIVSEGNITEQMARDVSEDYFEEEKIKWDNLNKILDDDKIEENKKDLNLSKIENYAFYLSTFDNIEYLIPNLEVLLTYTTLENTIDRMNLKNINFSETYKSLPKEIREAFVNNAINNKEIEELFKNKKILIINGSYNFIDNTITSFIYSNLINKVIDDYKKDYKIYYKAHPLFPVDKNLEFDYYKNIGLYAFTKDALKFFVNSKEGVLEKAEGLEMLRLVENRKKVKVIKIESDSMSVDTMKDLNRIRKNIKKVYGDECNENI